MSATTASLSLHNQELLRPVMPELDSIRGMAILMVVLYHGLYVGLDLSRLGPVARVILGGFWLGRLGVSLFFVLSGFLITGLLIDSRAREKYYLGFYVRRALRILPAYFATILILVATAYAPWQFIALSLCYLSNLTPLFGVPIAYHVLWSLAVEEHFYLFWPLVVRKLSERALAFFCAAVVLLSPISRAISFHFSAHDGRRFVFNEYTWNSIDGLACGALLALWLRACRPERKAVSKAAFLLLVGSVALESVGLRWGIYTRQSLIGSSLQVVPWHGVFVSLLCSFLLLGTSQWRWIAQWRGLRFFGDISYGLYLLHPLAFKLIDYFWNRSILSYVGTKYIPALLVRFSLASSLAIGVAWISRKTLESYFLSMKNKLAPP